MVYAARLLAELFTLSMIDKEEKEVICSNCVSINLVPELYSLCDLKRVYNATFE